VLDFVLKAVFRAIDPIRPDLYGRNSGFESPIHWISRADTIFRTFIHFRNRNHFFKHQVELFKDLYHKIDGRSREVGVVIHGGMVLIKKVPVADGIG